MYLGITKVKPLEDYKLLLTFENNEIRILDMSPYLMYTSLFNAIYFY
ncbi:MAG: DUF2442 domain-containing protein [Eubacteriales bacterium]